MVQNAASRNGEESLQPQDGGKEAYGGNVLAPIVQPPAASGRLISESRHAPKMLNNR